MILEFGKDKDPEQMVKTLMESTQRALEATEQRISAIENPGETPPQTIVKVIKSGGSGNITIDSEMSSTSGNPVQNKVIYEALDNIEVDTLANSDIQNIIDSTV